MDAMCFPVLDHSPQLARPCSPTSGCLLMTCPFHMRRPSLCVPSAREFCLTRWVLSPRRCVCFYVLRVVGSPVQWPLMSCSVSWLLSLFCTVPWLAVAIAFHYFLYLLLEFSFVPILWPAVMSVVVLSCCVLQSWC